MFKKEIKTNTQTKLMERNVIGKNTTIVGEVISDGDFRIDGKLEGSLKTDGRVVIGAEGFIDGNINCANADIEGKFSGQLTVSNILSIKATANISGDVITEKLAVEPGAIFNASCTMKGGVKELAQDDTKGKRTEKSA